MFSAGFYYQELLHWAAGLPPLRGLEEGCQARLRWSLRGGTFVPEESCIKEGQGEPQCAVTLEAQVHTHFHWDDSLAQVGLGENAAKAPFSSEECVRSGLTGFPKKDRRRINYTGCF